MSQYQWIGLLVAASYPAALYIFTKTRGDRDDPAVLKQRLLVITIYTLMVVLAVKVWDPQWFALIGLRFKLFDCLRALALTTLPYIGPIICDGVDLDIFDLMGIRNYLVGPLTEEVVYRGVICALYRLNGASLGTIVRITPLYFGVAHLHHARQLRLQGHAWPQILVSCSAHFLITWLFGMYTAFLWWHYESVWPGLVAHTFCNWIGAPRVNGGALYNMSALAGLAAFGWVLYGMK